MQSLRSLGGLHRTEGLLALLVLRILGGVALLLALLVSPDCLLRWSVSAWHLPREYLTQGAHRILDLVDLLPAQTVALALGVVRLRVVPSLKVQRLPQAVAVRIAPPPPRNAGQRAQLRHAGQTCASSRACCELVADVRRRRADKGHLSRPIIRSTRSSPMVSRHLRA